MDKDTTKSMKRILFQGDSITDAQRSTNYDRYRGCGYATLVSAQLGMDRPNEFEFINRGVSGNRVIDLLARVKIDIINLKPDYLSILIGVNDVWADVADKNGVAADKYEMFYNILIAQIKEALPDVKIMILEPFVLRGIATEKQWNGENSIEKSWDIFRSEVCLRAEAAKRVAEKNKLPFVPLMELFEKVQNMAPAEYWLFDGVHPTAMGHELIKREWIKAFHKIENE